MTSTLSVIGVLLPSAVMLAGLPLFILERRWRWRWNEVEVGRLPAHDAQVTPFRESGTVPDFMRRAPTRVRFTAFTCFLFGQMFIPGLVMGAFGHSRLAEALFGGVTRRMLKDSPVPIFIVH